MDIRKHLRRIAVAAAATLMAIGAGDPAAAIPSRYDTSTRDVYFVHGFWDGFISNIDCWSQFGPTINAMRDGTWRRRWTGTWRTVGFYYNDTNCNTQIVNGTWNTGIEELGRQLAWNIYNNYSRYDIPVDAIGHSMGGLVLRAAVAWSDGRSGWPPYIYVEDAVTVGTPHQGAGWFAGLCTFAYGEQQCMDMLSFSGFLNKLPHNPVSGGYGPDWTLIGSHADEVVATSSAMGMDNAGHRVVYYRDAGFSHMGLLYATTGAYRQRYWNYYNPCCWTDDTTGAPPMRSAYNATHYWFSW